MVIGCDQHKKYCVMVEIDEQSKVKSTNKFYHKDRETLRKYLSEIPKRSDLVIEACGYDSWLTDFIESYGHQIHLAHPLKTKAIAEAKVKTDKIDAKVLAQLLQAHLLPEAYHAPDGIRQQRALLRYRQTIIRIQTQTKNRIHFLIDRLGIEHFDVTDLFGKRGLEWLSQLQLGGTYQRILVGYLETLGFVKKEIKKIDSIINHMIKNNQQAQLLQTIPGIGKLTAFLLLAEIGPIQRFITSQKLCSYAGLTPSVHQSGQTQYHGHITKQGNKYIRWAMVEAAHRVIRKDPGLKESFDRIRFKRGTSVAIVAIARKLLVAVFHVLSKNEPYRYFRTDFGEARVSPALLRA